MSLRARLLATLAALAIVGLVVADVATYLSLRSFLTQRVDRTVDAGARVLAATAQERGAIASSDLAELAASTPGVFAGVISPGGGATWSPLGIRPGEPAPPAPTLPARIPDHTFTARAANGGARYRVRAEPLGRGQQLVIAAPLADVEDTLDRLVLVEGLVSLAVVAAVVGAGMWLVRMSLRPLTRIEEDAAAIGAGELGRRIPQEDPRTEVGRLGRALNAMLGQIEKAFGERAASEERMRRFVADASHELRTPLASVRAYAELFGRGARDRPQDLARAMAGIEREAERMGLLVDDLLLLARLDQRRIPERQPVDLSTVAGEALEVARTLDPGRPLTLDAARAVAVTGDPQALRQVIDNLLANVRAHTPSGTPATVRVVREGEDAVLTVADLGPGIAAEDREHVFERFFRQDHSRSRDGGGSGLGLAIVTAIAEMHGGSARVVPHDGPGAIFEVRLPPAGHPGDAEAGRSGPTGSPDSAAPAGARA